MNPWLWLLIAVLVLAPNDRRRYQTGNAENNARFDLRAIALLLCVIAVVAQP